MFEVVTRDSTPYYERKLDTCSKSIIRWKQAPIPLTQYLTDISVLATGVLDQISSVPGFKDFRGHDIFHCASCAEVSEPFDASIRNRELRSESPIAV